MHLSSGCSAKQAPKAKEIISKKIIGFLLEDELYASTVISKHLEEFLNKYLNGLQCKSAYWARLEKIGVELKISNGQKVSLHKSDVETSHDIPKFWWNF